MPRDANGNYTLPAGNPVAAGTVIETDWANPTMDDLAVALSDSLSRSGQGGMLAPFKNADGTLSNPGMTWQNMPTSGFFRDAAGMAAVWQGSEKMRWGPSGPTIGGLPILTTSGFPDGTVALPGITWISDTASGFYRDNTLDEFYAVINGVAKMAWTAAGPTVNGSPIITEATLTAQPRTFISPQRAAIVTQVVGTVNMNAANDFIINMAGALTLTFTNITVGQRGMIWLNNSPGAAVTAGGEVLSPADFEADVSAVGLYALSYWAMTGSAVAVTYAGPMV